MNLSDLDQYKTGGFSSDYPRNVRRFYTQTDDAHGVLVALIGSVERSLTILQFGYDDDSLNGMILKLLADPLKLVTISLDKSQAGGVHERAILQSDTLYLGNSISIGTSAYGHQISHEKGLCVDGRFVVGGSTNWSSSGEGVDAAKRQNNELSCFDDRAVAYEFEAQALTIHRFQLSQMAAAQPSQ